jgi:hypothetical protein
MTTALEPELSTYRWSSHDEADRFPVEDPATGEVITFVQGGGTAEVNAAVEAAHRAFQTDWRWRPPAERAALLLKAADILAEHADGLALLESRENGKPVADARSNDINFLIGVFGFFGSLVDKLPTDFYDKGAIYTSTYLEPVGVVGEIIPFNWPPIHAGGKMAPALAAGNTVVLKPSEQAPLTVMRIVELLNGGPGPAARDDRPVHHAQPGKGRRGHQGRRGPCAHRRRGRRTPGPRDTPRRRRRRARAGRNADAARHAAVGPGPRGGVLFRDAVEPVDRA